MLARRFSWREERATKNLEEWYNETHQEGQAAISMGVNALKDYLESLKE